jgi:transcription elongation factor Elf1
MLAVTRRSEHARRQTHATRTDQVTTIDCPFCDQPVELDLATAAELSCDGCNIRVEIARDPAPIVVAAAA